MSVDGQPRPPLLTDNARWRRAIFDFPQVVALQRMDDSFAYYRTAISLPEKTLVLTKGTDNNWKANLAFQQPVHDKLVVDGRMDDYQLHMELQLTDRNKFLLVKRGFHLIQESAYNR